MQLQEMSGEKKMSNQNFSRSPATDGLDDQQENWEEEETRCTRDLQPVGRARLPSVIATDVDSLSAAINHAVLQRQVCALSKRDIMHIVTRKRRKTPSAVVRYNPSTQGRNILPGRPVLQHSRDRSSGQELERVAREPGAQCEGREERDSKIRGRINQVNRIKKLKELRARENATNGTAPRWNGFGKPSRGVEEAEKTRRSRAETSEIPLWNPSQAVRRRIDAGAACRQQRMPRYGRTKFRQLLQARIKKAM
ncbi:hypothetical protein C8J57DRAFT_1220882 [Mycena rebaudengoi]|nr:hypothetical protein C8J57DRAFT_1220882 [Mycena rebaudengoi]